MKKDIIQQFAEHAEKAVNELKKTIAKKKLKI